MANISKARVVLSTHQVSFPHLGEPYASIPGAKEKYSATILIDKADTKELEVIREAYNQAIENGITKVFGGKRPTNVREILKDGDATDRDEFKGKFLLSVSSVNQPDCIDANLNPIDGKTIVGGDFIRVSCNFVAYNVGGSKGVSCYLQNVQLVEKARTPFSSKKTAKSDFASVNNEDFM